MISYFFNTDLDLLFGLLCYLQKRSENYAQIQRRMRNVCLDLKLLRYFEKMMRQLGGNVPNDLLYRFGSDENVAVLAKKIKGVGGALGWRLDVNAKTQLFETRDWDWNLSWYFNKILEKICVLCVLMMFFFLFHLLLTNTSPPQKGYRSASEEAFRCL